MVKKKTKRIKLSEKPQGAASSAAYPMPNNNGLAPNFRVPNDRAVGTDGRYLEAQTPFPAAAGAGSSGPNGQSGILQAAPESDASGFKAQQKDVPTQTQATGNSGTQIFGGYFSEEYLARLRGRVGAKQWDEMRRSEAQVSLLMNAIKNPIKAANWDFEPYDSSDPESVKQCEFVKFNILERIDFNTFKGEALTVLDFGFSLFEMVHDVVFNHPKFGTFNGLKCLGFRSQKTIENWQLEQKTGRLMGVNQYTYSDLGGNQFIPGEFCLVFTHAKEGDNYEGISVLRPMLGAYMRKELYLKLAAIGVERYAIGTPIGTVPKGKEKTKEYEEFINTLSNYTSHECSFITLPEGWKIDIQKADFDADKLKELLLFENTEMVNAVVANFLILGMNGGGGAYALGSNLGEFFTSGIQSYADLICDGVNRGMIKSLVKLNFGEQPGYPKMKVSGITDKAGKELAETIKNLTDSRALDPDMPFKEWLRKLYKMPKPDPATATPLPAIPAGAAANYPKQNDPVIDPQTGKEIPYSPTQLDGDPSNDAKQLVECVRSIKLADAKYIARFDSNKEKLKSLMQSQLILMYSQLKAKLKTKYDGLPAASKITAAKDMEIPGVANYKSLLRDQLSAIAAETLVQARKQVPNGTKVKLAQYDSLAPYVRKLINTQASLVAETQAADIEKMVYFQFTSSATSTDDIDAILNDVDEAVVPSLEGSTANGMSIDVAAGDAAAHIVQETSMNFFLDDDVVDSIESFTFTNEDPVSEICIAMTGTTVAPGDSILDQYCTPLHHNCKSRWVPNLKGDSDNPKIGSGQAQSKKGDLSLSKKALDSITLHEIEAYKFKPHGMPRYPR